MIVHCFAGFHKSDRLSYKVLIAERDSYISFLMSSVRQIPGQCITCLCGCFVMQNQTIRSHRNSQATHFCTEHLALSIAELSFVP